MTKDKSNECVHSVDMVFNIDGLRISIKVGEIGYQDNKRTCPSTTLKVVSKKSETYERG